MWPVEAGESKDGGKLAEQGSTLDTSLLVGLGLAVSIIKAEKLCSLFTAKDLNSEGQQRLDSRHVKAHYGGSQCHIKSDDRSCRASTSAKCRPIVLSAFMRQALLPVLLSSTK